MPIAALIIFSTREDIENIDQLGMNQKQGHVQKEARNTIDRGR